MTREIEDVWAYPRPPALVPSDELVVVTLGGLEIVRTQRALRILETSHPPTYYLPIADVRPGVLQAATGTSMCEWKGRARYFDLVTPERTEKAAAWTYPQPLVPYRALIDHVAVYPGRMDQCTVDGEIVEPQAGGFYGGWITSRVSGPFKGPAGTLGW